MVPRTPKTKTTAVILAVIFGLFSWLYTYQQNAWKFWLNLLLTIFTFGLWALVAYPWAIIDNASKTDEWYAAI